MSHVRRGGDTWRPGGTGYRDTMRKDFDARHVQGGSSDGLTERALANTQPERPRDDPDSRRGRPLERSLSNPMNNARSRSAGKPVARNDLPGLNVRPQQSSGAAKPATTSAFSPKSPFEGATTPKATDPRRRNTMTAETIRSPGATHGSEPTHKDVMQTFKEAMIAVGSRRQLKDKVSLLERKVAQLRQEVAQSAAHFPHKVYEEQLQTSLARHEKDLTAAKRDLDESFAKQVYYLSDLTKLFMAKTATTNVAEDAVAHVPASILQRLQRLEESNSELQAKLQQQSQAQNKNSGLYDERIKSFETKLVEQEARLRGQLGLVQKDESRSADSTDTLREKWDDIYSRIDRVQQSVKQDVQNQTALIGDLRIQHDALSKKIPSDNRALLERSDLDEYITEFNRYKTDSGRRFDEMEQMVSNNGFATQLRDLDVNLKKEISARAGIEERHQQFVNDQQNQIRLLDERLNPLRRNVVTLTQQVNDLSARTASFAEDDRSWKNQVQSTSGQLAKVQRDIQKNEHAIIALKSVYDNLSTEQLHKDIVATVFPYITTVKEHLDKHDKEIDVLRSGTAAQAQQVQDDLRQLLSDETRKLQESFKQLETKFQVLQTAHEKLDELVTSTSASYQAHGHQSEQVAGIVRDVARINQQLSERQSEIALLKEAHDKKLPEDFQQLRNEFSERMHSVVSGVTQAREEIDGRLHVLEEKTATHQARETLEDITMSNTPTAGEGTNALELSDVEDVTDRTRRMSNNDSRHIPRHEHHSTRMSTPTVPRPRSEHDSARKHKKRERNDVKRVVDEELIPIVKSPGTTLRRSRQSPAVDLTGDDDDPEDGPELSKLLQMFKEKPGASTATTKKDVVFSPNESSKRKSDAEPKSHRKHLRKT